MFRTVKQKKKSEVESANASADPKGGIKKKKKRLVRT